jgi:hypothetical protein
VHVQDEARLVEDEHSADQGQVGSIVHQSMSKGSRLHDWFSRLAGAFPEQQQAIVAAGFLKLLSSAIDSSRLAELYINSTSVPLLVSALLALHKDSAKGLDPNYNCVCSSYVCTTQVCQAFVGFPQTRNNLPWFTSRF